MPESRRKILCTFPRQLIKEPILYNLGKEFDVVYNIHGASITDEMGMVALELVGEEGEVERAVSHLLSQGVKIEPMDPDGRSSGESPPA